VTERRVRVAVLSGGRSSEHDISLASAASVVAALDPARFDVVAIEIGREGRWELPAAGSAALLPGASSPIVPAARHDGTLEVAASPLDVDVVLPILHGPFGEDGTVQGLCEILDVPYVGAGVLGSALAMDKAVCKAVLRDAGIGTAPSLTLLAHRDDADDPALHARIVAELGLPVFVKPARLGSSVGISKAADTDELAAAIALAFGHDDKILVERFIGGREVECGVLGNDAPIASAVGEILPHNDWYDFEAKYAEGGSDIVIPARISADDTRRIQDTSLRAFEACDLAGLARIDFFLQADSSVVLNEINTIPGFTSTSVYASLFAASGLPYAELLSRLIDLALERHARRSRLRY
jgi:D-alanine-D-alanine ligase